MNSQKKAALLGLLFALVFSGTVQAETFSFQGTVVNGSKGVPGCTVSLVHPVLGRSAPSVTDNFGRFVFSNIPVRSDAYYLEVYWGKELVHRSVLNISAAKKGLLIRI